MAGFFRKYLHGILRQVHKGMRDKVDAFNFKKYFNLRNLLVLIIFIVLYIIYSEIFQAVLLIVLFFPLANWSVRTSKYIKDFSIEMLTPLSIFLGYVYGWRWGAFFGVILGSYMWAQVSIKAKTIVSIFLCGVSAYLAELSVGWFPGNFVLAYLVVITIRNILGFIMYIPINTMFNNIVYTVSDAFFNTFIMSIVLPLLYKLVMLLPG
ncbi:MAG: hypothetical protein ABIJ34_07850 [archaeon]